MAVHETNCVVKYSTWPSSGVAVTNEGTGGASYNGTAAANRYTALPSGATAFAMTQTTDTLTIPLGTAINNFTTVTHEFIFKVESTGANVLLAKGYEYGIWYSTDTGGYLAIKRIDTGWTNYHEYYYTNLGFAVGNWYNVQITWDTTIGASPTYTVAPPVLKLNNAVVQIDSDLSSGTTTAWVNDSGDNATLWNFGAAAITGTITLFRWHNAILSDSYLTDNYTADYSRYGATNITWTEGVGNTVPNCTTAAPAPAVQTGAVIANCIVNYSTWPPSGVTVTNAGTAGSSYNGTAAANRYVTLPSGANAFEMTQTTDTLTVPMGAAIDNFSVITLEFIVKFGADGIDPTYGSNILYKSGWEVVLDPSNGGTLEMGRYNYTWVGTRAYTFANCGFAANNWYYIQITWDCTGYAAVPVVKVNNVAKTAVDTSIGTVTAWVTDADSNLHLWNYTAHADLGTFALFRWHNAILTNSNLTANYAYDSWRMGTWNETVIPTCTTSAPALTPTIVSNPSWTETIIPTCTTAVPVVTVTGGGSRSWTESVVPYYATSAAGAVAESVSITIGNTPTILTAAIVPTKMAGYIETVVPDCVVHTNAPSVLNQSSSSYEWEESNYNIPYCTFTQSSPSVTVGRTEVVIPTGTITASIVTVSKLLTWTETVVPNCFTTTPTPTVATVDITTWTENEVIPYCTAAAYHPSITIVSSISFAWTESTVPDCTTTTSIPNSALAFTETTVPDCATAFSSPAPTVEFAEIGVPLCVAASSIPTINLTQLWTQTVVPDCIVVNTRPKVGSKRPHARILALIPVNTYRIVGGNPPGTSARMIGTLQWENE